MPHQARRASCGRPPALWGNAMAWILPTVLPRRRAATPAKKSGLCVSPQSGGPATTRPPRRALEAPLDEGSNCACEEIASHEKCALCRREVLYVRDELFTGTISLRVSRQVKSSQVLLKSVKSRLDLLDLTWHGNIPRARKEFDKSASVLDERGNLSCERKLSHAADTTAK